MWDEFIIKIKKCERKKKEVEEFKVCYRNLCGDIDSKIRNLLYWINANSDAVGNFRTRETMDLDEESDLISELKRVNSNYEDMREKKYLNDLIIRIGQDQEKFKKLREKKEKLEKFRKYIDEQGERLKKLLDLNDLLMTPIE